MEYQFNYKGFNYYCIVQKSEFRKCNPIVVLGGAFQSMQSYNKHLEQYSQMSDVVLVDLPGTGKSDVLPHEFGIDFLVSTLHHMIEKLNLSCVELVCASYGTPIGIVFANTFPHMVSKLVLIGTMKAFPPHRRKQVERSFGIMKYDMLDFSENILNILMNYEKQQHIRRFSSVNKVLRKIVENTHEDGKLKYEANSLRLLHFSPSASVFDFETPTLVFTGEHDSFTHPDFCREVASSLRNSVFTTIKDSDHLCNIEQFLITNNLIAAFLMNNDLTTIDGINRVEKFSSN